MKHFLSFCCVLLLIAGRSVAQQTHFIYLQTDNHQPFYVMLKNKNYSSSSIGYVILPKLENGDYRIKVGFAKSDVAEQDYILPVKDNDQGFLIKDFGDKGAGLFNLQTLAIQYSGTEGKKIDDVANAKVAAEKEKQLEQLRKDSTERAEAVLVEQRKAENEARLATEAKQKEEAAAMAQQRAADSIKVENEAKIVSEAQQKKNAATLAKQQTADSIAAAKKALMDKRAQLATEAQQKQAAFALAKKQHADSIATAKKMLLDERTQLAKDAQQKQAATALAKKQRADSLLAAKNATAATAPQVAQKPLPKPTPQQVAAKAKADKKLALAKQVQEKRAADSLASQQAAENDATLAAAAQQKKAEQALAQQQAEEKAKAEEQQKKAELAAQVAATEAKQQQAEAEKRRLQAAAAAPQNDSTISLTQQAAQPTFAAKPVVATIVYQPVLVGKNTNDSGTNITYKIPSNKGWDTVSAFIAQQNTLKNTVNDTPPTTTEKPTNVQFLDMHFKQDSAEKANDMIVPVFKDSNVASNNVQPMKTEKPTVVSEQPNPAVVSPIPTTTGTTAATIPVANSNCKAMADDKDFYALRKKMVAQDDADEMILVAKKSMREKCYSSVQIRNLSALLITDADRYQFLESAYPFVSDANNYAALSDLLKDTYYIDRFKVMLRR